MKLILCAVCLITLAGCAMQLPRLPEMGFNWVSTEGKSQEQLYEDQAACRREVTLLRSSDSFAPGGRNWDLNEVREFDDCMRSKGWTKK